MRQDKWTGRRISTVLFFLMSPLMATAKVTYNLGYGDSSILEGATDDCLAAFNAYVTCQPTIIDVLDDFGQSFDQAQLETLCTDACYESLTGLREGVTQKCKDVLYYDPGDSSTWKSTILVESAMMAYNKTCLKRSSVFYPLFIALGVIS